MNRERAKALLPIIQAYVEGRTIQVRCSPKHGWEDILDPHFCADKFGYRIKPGRREGYVRLSDLHDHSSGCDSRGCIRVKEVL